jgi:hypothetical protein
MHLFCNITGSPNCTTYLMLCCIFELLCGFLCWKEDDLVKIYLFLNFDVLIFCFTKIQRPNVLVVPNRTIE